jgi:hypothetical protein
MMKAFNERRRRGKVVAPGVSPGITSSFFIKPALAGERVGRNEQHCPLTIASGSVSVAPLGLAIIFIVYPGLTPGATLYRQLRWLIDAHSFVCYE